MKPHCKRLHWFLPLLLALPALAWAQTTAVTATVVDPNGIPYAGGTVLPQLVTLGGPSPTLNGAYYVPPTTPATLDSAGHFSLSMADNSILLPAGSQWKFTVCSGSGSIQPAGGKGSVCFNVTLTISGASQDISTQLQAAALALSSQPNTLAPGNINGEFWVDGAIFPTIDSAYNACAATGCIIHVKAGTLVCPIVTISKGITIEGAGPGGFIGPGLDINYSSASTLTNGSTTANCINVGLGSGTILSGVVIKGLAVQGNKNVVGASTGDGISVVGGDSTTQLTNLNIQDVFVHDAKGVGIALKENVFGVNIVDTQIARNGSHGIAVTNSGTGAPSQIRLARVFDWLNTADGLNMNGTNVHDVSAVQSTFANNLNGVNVVVGSVNATFIATDRSNFEQNTNAGVLIKDGYGHAIRDSSIPGDSTQLFGVNVDPPAGANFVQNQITLDNNNFSNNVTRDVTFSANTHVALVLPQATNNYSYLDSSLEVARLDNDSSGGFRVRAFGGIFPDISGFNSNLGKAANPWQSVFIGAAATNNINVIGTATGARTQTLQDASGTVPLIIASGTSTFTTTAVLAGACQTTVTTAATNALTSDTITTAYTTAPVAATDGVLILQKYLTAGNVNFMRCNPTAGSITPTALVLTWRVIR